MIKKLRKRFISIAMLSISLVLVFIITTINVANYLSVSEMLDQRLDFVVDNGGSFSKNVDNLSQMKPPQNHQEDIQKRPFDKLNAEAAFDTRYFSVTFAEDGSPVETNTGDISAITTEEATDLASSLLDKGKTQGYKSHYKYRAVTQNGQTIYYFVDCERELNTFSNFLLASVTISLAGLLLVFLLVVVLSRKMMKPVIESYEKQKRFITDASHEIKTPLTIIDANTEVMEMTGGENEWTKSIHKQIQRLTHLTEKLVFLSRMDEENESYMNRVEFSLSDAVNDTVDPYFALARTKGKQLSIAVEDNLMYVGDEAAIRQMTSLLLDNAVKYSNENGEIRLQLQSVGKNKVLTVSNTVEEIEVGKQDMLFERFYRRDESRNSKSGGFGIGLSVVQAIVEAHKGKISAKSEDGKSICFTISLS